MCIRDRVSITPQVRCFSHLIVDGNATISNMYNKTQINTLLNSKVNTTTFNTLSGLVSVNSIDIGTIDTALTSGLNDRYTKTVSDTRYYTQTNADTLLALKQNTLSNEGSLGV